jgi:hypothetical protein
MVGSGGCKSRPLIASIERPLGQCPKGYVMPLWYTFGYTLVVYPFAYRDTRTSRVS